MSYLIFTSRPASGKTQVVSVASVRSGDLLARIAWFGRWRCYAFYPEPDTIWNIDCLHEIHERLHELNIEQRKKLLIEGGDG